ncbi:hypothetical protein CkaCkLH20_07032 [Colletotrichum karsti]|uniref:SCA7 domain-containing protein n=1 Tax=Colletotrichum karsti TaxID=1095194 RepID=A0A9P6I5V9_9PEZI|nr:uncharacterized protein CkaCkLH20_07032 [Colletotrichum karsti]KAF9875651.1 hypothetical protein CkaCkLH20_07032 [Colletotrichum karsti]
MVLPQHKSQSTAGFVAFGDSYSAGIGTGIQGVEDECRHGAHAHPFLSCTGSTTGDILSGGEHSQIDSFNTSINADFAVLSVGGNDLGFFRVMNACIFRFYSFYSGTCEAALQEAAKQIEGSEFEHRLEMVIMQILDKVQWEKRPWFIITVTGYARFFNADTDECDNCTLGVWWQGPKLERKVRRRMNDMVLAVNGKLRMSIDAVNAKFAKPKVVFVDYDTRFEGHRFCEPNVTEPAYNRTETWFFLVGGKDNNPNTTDPTPAPNSTSSGSELAYGRVLPPLSPLVDPGTCLGPAERSGDWGLLALCYMAIARHNDPTLRFARDNILRENSMWYVPTYYGKTFHPCDKIQPECSQCIRVGKKCPGYRDQLSLMFRDESTKVIKKAHAQWGVAEGSENGASRSSVSTAPSPPPSSSPAYSRKSTPTSTGAASRNGKAIASPASSFALTSPSSSSRSAGSASPIALPVIKQEPVRDTSPISIRVGPTLEEQGLQFYVNRYLVGHPDEVKSAQDLAGEPWVWHPALQDVMTAVGLAGLYNLTGNVEMMATAREKYGSALRQTGKLIRPPHNPSIDVTMRAVVALAMFEVVKGTHHSTGTVHAHVMGGAALMRSWCPMPSVPFGGFRALLQLCYSMVSAGAPSSPGNDVDLAIVQFIPLHVAGSPMPPDFYDWVSYGSQLQIPIDRPSSDLAVLIARFVEISSFVQSHVISDGKPKTTHVMQQLLDLDTDLAAWEAGLKGAWEYRVVHATHLPQKAVFEDDEQTIKVASKKEAKDRTNGVIKLKKQPPKHNKPGNWREGSVIDDDKKSKSSDSASISVASPGPVVNPLDDSAREAFATGRPLEDSPDLQQCKHCKKSILKTAAKAHIAQCLRLKKEKAQRKKEAREARERAKEAAREQEARKADEDGDGKGDDDSDGDEDGLEKKATGSKTAKKAAGKKTDGEAGKGKKRKADGDADKGPKQKKKKEEPKPKAPKPKGPVDVERQCGVLLPNGQPCARSLTCKSHSMGAKRAVAGRSLPYDMLLAAYQKKNQAKQQKAALDANAPLEDEDEANAGPVDSDEETAAVMNALAHWNPQPVVPQPMLNPIRRQYQLARLHEQLQMATNGGRTNIFKVVGFGAQKLPDGHPGLVDTEDAPGEPDTVVNFGAARRSSSFSMQGQPQRRQSLTSRA